MFIGKEGYFAWRALESILLLHDVVGIAESGPRDPALARSFHSYPWNKPCFIGSRKSRLERAARKNRCPYIILGVDANLVLSDFLKVVKPDLICIASMSQLLSPENLSLSRLGGVNVHPSLLPKYRGPNPWFWQCHQMEREGGVTVHRVDQGSDTGDILGQGSFPLPLGIEFPEVLRLCSETAASLLPRAVERVEQGEDGTVQRHWPCPLYARRVKPDEQLIEWSEWSLERVWHVLRGTRAWLKAIPQPGGWRRGFTWKIGPYEYQPSREAPGSIQRDRKGFYVAHPEGRIRLSMAISGRRL